MKCMKNRKGAGPVDIMFAFSVLMKVEECFGEKSGIKTEYICENERIDRCTSKAVKSKCGKTNICQRSRI